MSPSGRKESRKEHFAAISDMWFSSYGLKGQGQRPLSILAIWSQTLKIVGFVRSS